jgi:hypothetical protein
MGIWPSLSLTDSLYWHIASCVGPCACEVAVLVTLDNHTAKQPISGKQILKTIPVIGQVDNV